MSMEGDGLNGQPSEGVSTMNDLVALMDGGEESVDEAPDDSAEEHEEAEESELVEGEEEGAEESEEEGDEPEFTIKVDGKDVKLKQSELIEQAQKGFDYTQKTMAVAEQRKAAEAVQRDAESLRERHAQALTEQIGQVQALERFLAQTVGDPPHISLAQQDAQQYLVQKELYEHRKGQLEQAQTAIHNLTQEQARQRQAWIQQQADATERALRDTLPGWNDDRLESLAKYASDLGLTPDKVDIAFVQAGFWQMADKAKAYDDLMAKKAEMKPVAKLAKVAKPGTNNQPPQLAKRQEALKAHKAKPSINSLANLL